MVGGKHLLLNSRTRPYYDRMCKKARWTINIESLPDELLREILVRVPADDLYHRASLVCCKWYHMIRSHAFVNAHLEQCSTNYGLMVFSDDHRLNYVSVTKQGQIEISELDFQCTSLSSCNGLIMGIRLCSRSNCRGDTHSFVFNPATKQTFHFSPFVSKRSRLYSCCFAYDAASMVYKLVQPCFPGPLAILSVGVDNSWRRVQHFSSGAMDFSRLLCTPLITEGYMHWVWGNEKVLTMNVETEIITETVFPLPRTDRKFYLSTGRYLTLLVSHVDYVWNVWEMKPEESGEWKEQRYNIKFEAQQLQQLVGCFCDNLDEDHYKYMLSPVGWVKYPEVLAFGVECADIFIFYNLRTHQIDTTTRIPSSDNIYYAFPHRNTLARLSQV